ncbi:Tad domain-containing protein [Novosphingobium sp. Chol11]|uniref:Tad domain-containing protein n=1 Tax=Novosphingobium sp. Chol11 TaxID=1385763 RepID=UPI0025FE0FFF|nr:Tad domain-containing protein [Novosphingobium sp. Chol11]
MDLILLTMMLLISMVGSGTDMARSYMARTSLQNACDAGVLAGRKALTKSATYGNAEIAKANKMFNFNFNAKETNTTSLSFTSQADGKGSVTGSATAVVPTTIMALAGVKTIPLTVTCSAELQMASADVMFVLDVTGSMACTPSGGSCNSGSSSKIVGLRSAVASFYNTVAAAVVDPAQSRIRFAFVPYSQTVNASSLVASGKMPLSYFDDTAPYQTRLYYFNTPVYVPSSTSSVPTTQTYPNNITSANCTLYRQNRFPTVGTNPETGGGPPPAITTSTAYSANSWVRVSGSGSSALGTCIRNVATTTTSYVTNYQFTNYRWTQATVNVSDYKGLGNVTLASSVNSTATVPSAGYYDARALGTIVGTPGVTGVTTKNDKWNGCIEERATVQTATWNPIPAAASDLDMDSEPTDDATSWKIAVDDLVFNRNTYNAVYDSTSTSGTSSVGQACPAPMMQFTNVDVTQPTVVPNWLTTYLDSLVATGSTYHDIGMIWGGRLASPTGIFADNVNEAFGNGVQTSISRHIIFMTDGDMAPSSTTYSAYGLEQNDQRVAPQGSSNSTLRDRHNSRFVAACGRAKALGYTIWVIGFGTSLNTQLTSCATANRAYYASNTTELTNTFRYIAGQVADLRINK